MSDPTKPEGVSTGAPPQEAAPAASASAAEDAELAAELAAGLAAELAAGLVDAPIDVTAVLEERVKTLDGQIADLTDRLLRAHAEMDNVRKRTEREKVDTAKYAISKFAEDIVTVGDNFQRAVAAVPAGSAEEDGPLKALVEGIVMTERSFLQTLEKHGVKQLDPKGEAFDPNRHQAVMEQQNTEVAAGTVLQVFQVGYMIEDRVLRPAMVVVARGGFKPVKTPDANGGPAATAARPTAANENAADGDEKPRAGTTGGEQQG